MSTCVIVPAPAPYSAAREHMATASSRIAPEPMPHSSAQEDISLLLGASVLDSATLKVQALLCSPERRNIFCGSATTADTTHGALQDQGCAVPVENQYVLLVFSASYCEHCEVFIEKLKLVASRFLNPRVRTSTVMVVNDREKEAFEAYIKKSGLPALPHAETQVKKGVLRDAWGITTIPHCVLLDRGPGQVLHANVRFSVEKLFDMLQNDDGKQLAAAAQEFFLFTKSGGMGSAGVRDELPSSSIWHLGADHPSVSAVRAGFGAGGGGGAGGGPQSASLTLRERFFLKKRIFQQGHKVKPGSEEEYMDEEVVRVRAGLFNVLVWVVIVQHFFKGFGKDVNLVPYIFPLVIWDFLAGSFIGLTPFAPVGVLATCIAHALRLLTKWKPARPKRFAWLLGVAFTITCFSGVVFKTPEATRFAIFCCLFATWLEAACGFCAGCAVWNNIIVPRVGLKVCECNM